VRHGNSEKRTQRRKEVTRTGKDFGTKWSMAWGRGGELNVTSWEEQHHHKSLKNVVNVETSGDRVNQDISTSAGVTKETVQQNFPSSRP
jgi:hypothetical protein